MGDDLKLLIRTSRPIVWLWFSFPFLVGAIISGTDISNPLLWLEFLALGPLYCLLVYGINDIYDYESDKQNPRKGEDKSQGDILKPEKHGLVMKASIISSLFLILLSLATLNTVNILGMLFLVVWAVTYSAPPVRLKEIPVLDSLSNGLGYVLVPSIMGFSFGAPITEFPLAGVWVAFAISGMHAAFAVMDYKPDKKAGLNTIAVRFGPEKTIGFSIFAIGSALIFSPLKSLIPILLLSQLLGLVLLMALDIYEIVEFKKKLRDYSLGFIYVEGLILTTIFLINMRIGIY